MATLTLTSELHGVILVRKEIISMLSIILIVNQSFELNYELFNH